MFARNRENSITMTFLLFSTDTTEEAPLDIITVPVATWMPSPDFYWREWKRHLPFAPLQDLSNRNFSLPSF